MPCNKLVGFKSSKHFGKLGTISVSTGNYCEETEASIVINHTGQIKTLLLLHPVVLFRFRLKTTAIVHKQKTVKA